MADVMDIEILEDGTISVKTDKISQANHFSADEFLNELEEMLGGERKTEKRKAKHHHVHRTVKAGH